MTSQHLSDEALAAFADGVLRGSARGRAISHVNGCPECAHAVAVQREAVWALRAAPAPPLPTGLFDRLKALPETTPITAIPSALSPDGSPLFPTFGQMSAAALTAPTPAERPSSSPLRKAGPLALTAAALAAAGVVAFGTTVHSNASTGPAQQSRLAPGTGNPGGAVFRTVNELRIGGH